MSEFFRSDFFVTWGAIIVGLVVMFCLSLNTAFMYYRQGLREQANTPQDAPVQDMSDAEWNERVDG